MKAPNLLKEFILTLIWIFSLCASSQTINFTVTPKESCIDMPISIPMGELLGHINIDPEKLALYEISSTGEKLVYCQVESDYSSHLWFILEGLSAKNFTRKFCLKIQEENPIDTLNTDIHIYKSGENLILR